MNKLRYVNWKTGKRRKVEINKKIQRIKFQNFAIFQFVFSVFDLCRRWKWVIPVAVLAWCDSLAADRQENSLSGRLCYESFVPWQADTGASAHRAAPAVSLIAIRSLWAASGPRQIRQGSHARLHGRVISRNAVRLSNSGGCASPSPSLAEISAGHSSTLTWEYGAPARYAPGTAERHIKRPTRRRLPHNRFFEQRSVKTIPNTGISRFRQLQILNSGYPAIKQQLNNVSCIIDNNG